MRFLERKFVQSPIESVYVEEELEESGESFQALFNLMLDRTQAKWVRDQLSH